MIISWSGPQNPVNLEVLGIDKDPDRLYAYLVQRNEEEPKCPACGAAAASAAKFDCNPRTFNCVVVLKAAEYVEFDARPVLGRVVVPMRDALLLVSEQYDEADEASFA